MPKSIFFICVLLLSNQSSLKAEKVLVDSYYGDYISSLKSIGKPSTSLKIQANQEWQFSPKLKNNYSIAILLPHLNDSYWLAINYGLLKQSKNAGISFQLKISKNYYDLWTHRQQLIDISKQNVDGVIIASLDYKKFDSYIEAIRAKGIPVVALVNDIQASTISAKSMVSFYDMGYQTGSYFLDSLTKGPVRVAFFPGPIGSGWAKDSFEGFKKAIEEKNKQKIEIEILPPWYADTSIETQATMMKRALHSPQKIDYFIGNAVMAEIAKTELEAAGNQHIKTISTYITPNVFIQIQKGYVLGAPTDFPLLQARLAIDLLQKIIQGGKPGSDIPFRVSPQIGLITRENIKNFTYEDLFGDKEFKPVLFYSPE